MVHSLRNNRIYYEKKENDDEDWKFHAVRGSWFLKSLSMDWNKEIYFIRPMRLFARS